MIEGSILGKFRNVTNNGFDTAFFPAILASKFCLDSHPHISLLCRSRREGGLGLKKLIDVNRAMLMKLWVSIRDSDKTWTKFLKAKYFK
ncbi:hypothetical protein C5167_022399, partial [Papaver somniferum]